MNRHLYIITNRGQEQKGQALSVDYDLKNYIDFFSSPEGGAWDEEEITTYENNFHFEAFAKQMQMRRNAGLAYDYIVMVFCGHGCSDRDGEKWIEIRPDNTSGSDISISQFEKACDGSRTLFISDSCLSLYAGPLRKTLLFSQLNDSCRESLEYHRQFCKDLYNHYVSNTPEGIFITAFAASMGETAKDTGEGGLYSLTLLETAKDYITALKKDARYAGQNVIDFVSVHNIAASKVATRSNNKQHPMILGFGLRSKAQLPFVVVPKYLES